MKHTIQPSTDGFIIPRRPVNSGGGLKPTLNSVGQPASPGLLAKDATAQPLEGRGKLVASARPSITQPFLSSNQPNRAINLDVPPLGEKLPAESRRARRQRKADARAAAGKRRWTKKRIIMLVVALLVVAALGIGGYFAYKFIATGSKIFKGNVVNALFNQGKSLRQDAHGRTNIVLFGTSEDDGNHPGADLTDSIMIASLNQTSKDAFLVSVPRDLWVSYGQACPAGYQGKINALYQCVKDQNGEDAGQQALRNKVSEVFGLDVQYAVHVNYTVLRESVDAVGGITVAIDSTDPRGILDRNFDWNCPKGSQTCYNVKYPNGPAKLDGIHALYLARARGDDPQGRTYGLAQANFDREKYQRAILVALKDKAVSAGTLANPVAIDSLLNTLGNNVRTNFDAGEIKTLVKVGQSIKSTDISSVALNSPDNPLVTTGSMSDQSIVRPSAGLTNYSVLQATILAYATGDLVGIEKAAVDVLNASGTPGKAQTQASSLASQGFIIKTVANAPSTLGAVPLQLIDLSNGKKPGTLKKLQTALGVTAKQGAPAGISSSSDFVVVIGTPAPAANGQ